MKIGCDINSSSSSFFRCVFRIFIRIAILSKFGVKKKKEKKKVLYKSRLKLIYVDKLEFRISFIEVYTYEKEIYIYVAHKQSKITFPNQRIRFREKQI